MNKKQFMRFTRILCSCVLILSFVFATAAAGFTYADSALSVSEANVVLVENCTADFGQNTLTITDTDDNNDVWSSKLLLDSGMELTPGEQYKLSYDLSGENGVGEFFLCKGENMDDRYDGTFASEAGNRSISFTAEGSKVYFGMQVGNLGKGNSVTAAISDLCKLSESECPSLLRTENCDASAQNGKISATDTSDNNDVWNSKILYDHGVDLEIGKTYKLDFSLSGDNGVGEFFICRSQDLNDRYDATFVNTPGTRSITFTAASDKLYIGMQFGNLGKGNSLTAEITGINEASPATSAAAPQNGGSDGSAKATNCTYTVDGNVITVTDSGSNNDVWDSKLLYDAGIELEPGKTYEIRFKLSGDNGVGEFFLCKSDNIDDRYDATFTNEAGERVITFTATGTKAYIGMQVGNLGKGNTVTAEIGGVTEVSSDPEQGGSDGIVNAANCTYTVDGNVITVTDTGSNNDVWNSKLLYDAGIELEPGKTYEIRFKLSGDNGVGEFFLCKSDNIDDRYDATFTNEAGERVITFTATGTKAYIGMQVGNIGQGNSVTAEIAGVSEVTSGEPEAQPGGSEEDPNAINCTYTVDGNVITVTDTGSNNDVWNSKLLYDAGIELEPGKTYEIRFKLSGDNGVGEFFLCKSDNIDDRYDATFTNEAGERVITFTATGTKAYIGMQVGNIGQGNSVTAEIAGVSEVTSGEPEAQPGGSEEDPNAINCTYTVDGNVITVTDQGSNNDVWDSKLLYDAGIELEEGKTYEIRFTLSGENGVGEFFLCKSMDINDRYDETFTSEAGEKVITFTAAGTRAYIGMQVGNLGSGNSVTATIPEVKELEAEEPEQPQAQIIMSENCTYEITAPSNQTVIKAVDNSEETDVWTSKLLLFLGEILEKGRIYASNFNLAGKDGVGEFFFLKNDNDNMNDRYDSTFRSAAGDHQVKFAAEDSKLYAGMQFGNIGVDNDVTLSIYDIFRIPGMQKSNENCAESLSQDKITITDSSDNNDVWNSKAVYDTGIVLEPGKTYTATVTLSGENGVGEFFFLKSDDIDNRYNTTFTNEAGERIITFTAEGDALYFGVQCGNIGKGNSMTISNISVSLAENQDALLGKSLAAPIPSDILSEDSGDVAPEPDTNAPEKEIPASVSESVESDDGVAADIVSETDANIHDETIDSESPMSEEAADEIISVASPESEAESDEAAAADPVSETDVDIPEETIDSESAVSDEATDENIPAENPESETESDETTDADSVPEENEEADDTELTENLEEELSSDSVPETDENVIEETIGE